MDNERRVHDTLRLMVDNACKGLMPHIADRIKDTARRAYYLGINDGMTIEHQTNEKEKRNEDCNNTNHDHARASAGD